MTAEFLSDGGLAAQHGFFTRRGGVSAGPYASLNCSLSGGDDTGLVAQNRARAAGALGAAAGQLVGVSQVHGNVVATVDVPWPAGSGPRADAMVTARRGVALGVITADCAPVLFVDAAAGVVGAAHAGWRGAAGGVLEATVAAMVALGARAGDVAAVVGPCIGQASYEVGDDLRDQVAPGWAGAAAMFLPGVRPGHWQFDLAGYCVGVLRRAGVGSVSALGVDTCADAERFFSHRRRTLAGGGPIGHQLSAIVLL